MVRPLFTAALILFLAPAAFPADGVKIADIGLKGYYTEQIPTRIRILLIHTGPQAAKVELRIRVHGAWQARFERVDTFTKSVMMGPNEQRVVDVPVLLFHMEKPSLEVEEVDEKGGVIGRDSTTFEPPLRENLIALVCAVRDVCQEAQSQISFSGSSSEQTEKGKGLKFVALENPPEEWWGYSPAKTVVLAEPIGQMAAVQREALEGFVRQGGSLIVIEGGAHEASFLDPYRAAAAPGVPAIVGSGKVFWVSSLQRKELGAMYAGAGLVRAIQCWHTSGSTRDEMSWARRRLTTHFHFPTLTWLLAWLTAYILIAGLGNFTVLRRMGRREWGWITLPCLSLLFAFGMYWSSATTRSREFRAEDVTLYWMDENSSIAAIERGERISSPRRGKAEFVSRGDDIFAGDREGTMNGMVLNPFDDDSASNLTAHWNVQLGPPTKVELRMLQWSFRYLEFSGVERRPGTVRMMDARHLRNETGKNFRQALYVDEKTAYFLDAVAAGAEIDLSAARQKPLEKVTGSRLAAMWGYPTGISEVSTSDILAAPMGKAESGIENGSDEIKILRGRSEKPFEPAELIRAWPAKGGHAFESRSGIFFGLADEADPPVSLSDARVGRGGYSITIVSFGRRP